jgi:hypothetical protein
MTAEGAGYLFASHRRNSKKYSRHRKIFFTVFVNAMFTTFVEPLFTKAFD